MKATASRIKPANRIEFSSPMVGLNGNTLTAYTWAYEWSMEQDSKGELVEKRISDWDRAIQSEETGRLIVHQFEVTTPEGFQTVSSESVAVLLGYASKKEFKAFPSLVNTLKTLAKNRMELAAVEAKHSEYIEARNTVQVPEVVEIDPENCKWTQGQEPGRHRVWDCGGHTYVHVNHYIGNGKYAPTTPMKEDLLRLESNYRERVANAAGLKNLSWVISDLKARIARLEKKLGVV